MSEPLERDDIDLRIDDVLRRSFAPPPATEMPPLVHARPRRWALRLPLLAAAAAILLAAWAFWRTREPRVVDPATLPSMWVAAYHDAVARGFDSVHCCDGNADLRACCRAMFAIAVDVRAGADVELCGAYCGLPAGGAAAMLARSGSEPLCVFVLPRDQAQGVRTGAVAGLWVHRREVGALVVFEVSRLDDARVLPHLYVPEG